MALAFTGHFKGNVSPKVDCVLMSVHHTHGLMNMMHVKDHSSHGIMSENFVSVVVFCCDFDMLFSLLVNRKPKVPVVLFEN